MQESGGGLWFLIICLVILDNIAMPKVNKSICIGTTIAVLVLLFMLARRVKEDFKVNVIPPNAKFSVKKLELSMKSPGKGKGKGTVTSVVTDETDGMKSAVGSQVSTSAVGGALSSSSAGGSSASTSTGVGQTSMMTALRGAVGTGIMSQTGSAVVAPGS